MEDYKRYFKENEAQLAKLENLHNKKYKLKEMMRSNSSAFIVEFAGLPRTGKTGSMDKIHEFFRMADFNVQKTREPAQILKESISQSEIARMSNFDFNTKTLEISKIEIARALHENPDIIIADRGIVDNYFWYQMMYEEGSIRAEVYEKLLLDLMRIDQLYVLTAHPAVIIIRDYINQIYLEPRSKTTLERVTKLKSAFENLIPLLQAKNSGFFVKVVDTTNISEVETSIIIADSIMDGMMRKLTRKS